MGTLDIKLFDGKYMCVCLNCLNQVDDKDSYCRECGVEFEEDETLGSIEDIVVELIRLKFVKRYEK